MENRYIFDSHGSRSRWRSSEEFQEEDVWGSVRTKVVQDSDSNFDSNSDSRVAKRLPTASSMIPKSGNNNNNKNNRNPTDPRIIQQSAPVNIPDWSKIYRTNNSKQGSGSYSWLDPDSDDDDDGNRDNGLGRSSWEREDDEEEEDGEGNVLPPHEWVARKLARSQISSFSVFEGAGRTLKGRDLSRVRNDVLTKTGFLE